MNTNNGDVYLTRGEVFALLPSELASLAEEHFGDVAIPRTACDLQQRAYVRARAIELRDRGLISAGLVATLDLRSWQ